jgi:hypothetical protein
MKVQFEEMEDDPESEMNSGGSRISNYNNYKDNLQMTIEDKTKNRKTIVSIFELKIVYLY